jgi:hypothetical protein
MWEFLDREQIKYADAARRMGIPPKTLNTYWNDNKDGKRNKARAEVLFMACAELGFIFEYQGRKVGALSQSQNGTGTPPEQLSLPFARTFDLTDESGSVSVSVRRPAGRVEVSVSLKAVS